MWGPVVLGWLAAAAAEPTSVTLEEALAQLRDEAPSVAQIEGRVRAQQRRGDGEHRRGVR
jgi:hypothetical protein